MRKQRVGFITNVITGLSGSGKITYNTRGGSCENCEGYVTSNMLFFKDIEVTCPVCGGNNSMAEFYL